jgi:hypothetical protein
MHTHMCTRTLTHTHTHAHTSCRWPFAPFWDLPRARAVRYAAIGSLDGMDE